MKLSTRLMLVAAAPIVLGLVYNKCFNRNSRIVSLVNLRFPFIFLCLTAFRRLLHFMLPKKRISSEKEVVTEIDSSDSEGLVKKHRIDCSTEDGNSGGDSISSERSDRRGVLDMALGNGNMQEIDEDLHSRQLAVYGRETMRRLFASNVLISGMQGLGAEIGTSFR